jgi:hypothetical protein
MLRIGSCLRKAHGATGFMGPIGLISLALFGFLLTEISVVTGRGLGEMRARRRTLGTLLVGALRRKR